MAELNLFKHSTIPWKKHKDGYEFFRVKKGQSRYGELRRYPNGRLIYWALRKPDEIFLKLDSWAFDTETVSALKMRSVTHVGVLVTTGDVYLTKMDSFKTEAEGGKAKILNYSKHIGAKGKLGALQWYVPLDVFVCVKAPEQGTLDVMKIGGGKR